MREQAAMENRVVRAALGHPKPDMADAVGRLRLVRHRLDEAEFPGPLRLPYPSPLRGQAVQATAQRRHMVRQRFGRRYDGCGKLVIETGLRLLEGRGHVEDLVAVLDRHNAPAREAAAVAAPVDLVDDRRLEV